MCGGCRVDIGGETKFACVDGPDFDGFLVDFDEVITRQTYYKAQENIYAFGGYLGDCLISYIVPSPPFR